MSRHWFPLFDEHTGGGAGCRGATLHTPIVRPRRGRSQPLPHDTPKNDFRGPLGSYFTSRRFMSRNASAVTAGVSTTR